MSFFSPIIPRFAKNVSRSEVPETKLIILYFSLFSFFSLSLIILYCDFSLGSSSFFLKYSLYSELTFLERIYFGITKVEIIIKEIIEEIIVGKTIEAFSGVIRLFF